MLYQEKQRLLIESVRQQVSDGIYSASIVSEQTDYDLSKKRSLTAVCIPAKQLKKRMHDRLISSLSRLQPNHYYYSSDQLHFTVKNIRIANDPKTFTHQNVNQVQSLFARLIPQCPAFNIDVTGLVSFPTSLSVIGYTDKVFGNLVKTLDDGLNEIGVPDDKIYISKSVYFTNCTICRYRGRVSKSFQRKVNYFRNINLGGFKVNTINLVSCNPVFKSRKVLGTFYLKD